MRGACLLIATFIIGIAFSYADESAIIIDHVKRNKEVCDRARVNVHKNPQYYDGIVKACNGNSKSNSSIQSVFNNVPKGLLESLENNGSVLKFRGNGQFYPETDMLADDPFFGD